MSSPIEEYGAIREGILEAIANAAHYRDLALVISDLLTKYGNGLRIMPISNHYYGVLRNGIVLYKTPLKIEAYRWALEQMIEGKDKNDE